MTTTRSKKKKSFSLLVKLSIGASITLAGLSLGFFSIPRSLPAGGFTSLTALAQYCASHSEFPPLENTDLLHPDYTGYHRSLVPGFFSGRLRKLGSLLHIGSPEVWNTEYAQEKIEAATAVLTRLSGAQPVNEPAQQATIITARQVLPDTRIIIVGELAGAFFSLVRNLEELKKLGEISEELTLVKPNTQLLFLGDAISRSPHGLETVTLLAELLIKNEGRVIYIQGNHEAKGYWHDKGMRDQIRIRVGDAETKSYVATIDAFFAQLPQAAYFVDAPRVPNQVGDIVRISHKGMNESETLKESSYSSFITGASSDKFSYKVLEQGTTEITGQAPITLAAIIRAEQKSASFQTMAGLRHLPNEQGIPAWTVFSCPTYVVQKGLKFFHDAFVILSKNNQGKWELELHNRDSRTKDPFSTSRSYLVS